MRFYSDDPAADAERYMDYLDQKLARRPVCDHCKKHIQDDSALHYGNTWLCLDCVDELTEYIEEE
jgi:hypothetical protein